MCPTFGGRLFMLRVPPVQSNAQALHRGKPMRRHCTGGKAGKGVHLRSSMRVRLDQNCPPLSQNTWQTGTEGSWEGVLTRSKGCKRKWHLALGGGGVHKGFNIQFWA